MMSIGILSVWALTAALNAPAAPPAADVVWNADQASSHVTLSVSRLLGPKVTGMIPIVSAQIVTVESTVVPLSVNATLDANRLDTHDARRDADLRSAHFFDVARFPTITFSSQRVVPTGPQSCTIDGQLTMRGITHAMRFDTHFIGLRTNAAGVTRARYEAMGRFHRSDYGMTYAPFVVGNDVTLDVTIEAARPPSP
jgi:polyisoprenoid-binding protein YceI